MRLNRSLAGIFPSLGALLRPSALFAAMALLAMASQPALGDEHVLVQGLTDAEFWNTSAQSAYLSRNAGDPAAAGRLRLWAVGDFAKGLQGFVLGRIEAAKISTEEQTDSAVDQAYLRYSFSAPQPLVLQAGKLSLPYGNFSRRYFSSQNPLIGSPKNYEISYPLGIQISGALKRFDFMAAALDGPLTHQEYDSPTESVIRPALAAGVTPLTGFRIGAYFTRGPYLSRISEAWILPDKSLSDFNEQVAGLDLQYSLAHFEFNGEMTQARLQVPAAGDARGRIWYVEPKYTFSPRWYAAMRYERGDLPSPVWIFNTTWSAQQERIHDLETAIGFRILPGLLAKASYRTEFGSSDPAALDQGRVVAVQLSYSFDVKSWFQSAR
jgi:hypothetical protein